MFNNIIYMARFIIEAATPLAVGSGEKGLLVDRLIARDANGLPYIPGTSLAGLLRHQLENLTDQDEIDDLFGFQLGAKEHREKSERLGLNKAKVETAMGSRVVLSPALLLSEDGQSVHEGLEALDFSQGYYSYFHKLPERDHVRISHRGAADVKGHGKFDEELVHKGTRFTFEIEMEGTMEDQGVWETLVSLPHQLFFRIGAGTRKGFGQIKVLSSSTTKFDLSNREQLLAYLGKSSSLNGDYNDWLPFQPKLSNDSHFIHYNVELKPNNFFYFGAGFGDEDVDMKPKTERYFDWSSGKAELVKAEQVLIPASSIKGALSHRVAYHYNRLSGYFLSNAGDKAQQRLPVFDVEQAINHYFTQLDAKQHKPEKSDAEGWEELAHLFQRITLDDLLNGDQWRDFQAQLPNLAKASTKDEVLAIGELNDAVRELFGFAKDDSGKSAGARGKVLISDIYLPKSEVQQKVFSHVMIDRFVAGAHDGAFYQEKAVQSSAFHIDIFVEQSAFANAIVKQAFEHTLKDLESGQLQLGGNTTKGHGAFTGNSTVNPKIEYHD